MFFVNDAKNGLVYKKLNPDAVFCVGRNENALKFQLNSQSEKIMPPSQLSLRCNFCSCTKFMCSFYNDVLCNDISPALSTNVFQFRNKSKFFSWYESVTMTNHKKQILTFLTSHFD